MRRREHRAQRDVMKDVEGADVLAKPLGEIKAASASLASPSAAAARRPPVPCCMNARSFHQHDPSCRAQRRVPRAAPRRAPRVRRRCVAPAPNCGDARARRLAQRKQRVDAARRAHSRPTSRVKCVAVLADLTHVAQHQQLAAAAAAQHVDCRAHRIGIGVVGVVDERDAGSGTLHLQATLHWPNAAKPRATAAGVAPAALAAAAAASALRTLCTPGIARVARASPSGSEMVRSLASSVRRTAPRRVRGAPADLGVPLRHGAVGRDAELTHAPRTCDRAPLRGERRHRR